MKYGIYVVKRGYIEIDANELDTASAKALGLPDAAFNWEAREIESCEEVGNSGGRD